MNHECNRSCEIGIGQGKSLSYILSLFNMGATLGFKDYVKFDDELSLCATGGEEIVDLSESMNGDSNAGTDNETHIKTHFVMPYIVWKMQTYFSRMQLDVNDAVFYSLHKVEK
ncbi:hypothetical protein TNCV_1439981 [Trichonephila clavipes]|nr:hypothetical protein TNCV_1439981 [Trichonephila clavipes]